MLRIWSGLGGHRNFNYGLWKTCLRQPQTLANCSAKSGKILLRKTVAPDNNSSTTVVVVIVVIVVGCQGIEKHVSSSSGLRYSTPGESGMFITRGVQ